MMNLYEYYNKPGLDNEEYGPLITQLLNKDYSSKLVPIEHIIKKYPRCAWYYATLVLKGRFIEAEPGIMQDPELASCYAAYILKGRWKEAEPFIKTDKWCWDFYCKKLFGDPKHSLNFS